MTIVRAPQPVALMYDPYSGYAERLAHRLWGDHGVRVVALHTNWRERLIREGRAPYLRGDLFAAHVMVPPAGPDELLPVLRRDHRVVAVVPHDEGSVAPLARLADRLGLSWAQPHVLPAFRDKAALKALVARGDPGLRLNRVGLVADPAQVRQWVEEHGIARLVLKPNDGSGNRNVLIVDSEQATPARLAQYFAAAHGPVLAEEYVGGQEYWVNGQVDHAGVPTVTGIGTYRRVPMFEMANLELGCRTLASTDPVFGAVRDYAVRVVRATGLRRSPFHLEAKVDADGPCLIEVAARLCGDQRVLVDAWQHGPAADPIGAALHGYLYDEAAVPLALDWARRDAHPVAQVNGFASRRLRIARVEGVDAVEAMPGFLWWVKLVTPGATVLRTHDLVSKPWCLDVTAADETALDEVEERIRATLRLVGDDGPLQPAERMVLLRGRLRRYWSARPRWEHARPLRRS